MSCNPSQGLNHYYLVIIISNNDTQTENNMSVFYVVFCNIAFHITCEYRKKNEKENYYLTFTQIFWENFRIISASLINVNGKHTPTQLKKITLLLLGWLKEHFSSNVPRTAPEMQNAPLPGLSPSLAHLLTVPATWTFWSGQLLPVVNTEQAKWHRILCLIRAHSLLHVLAPAQGIGREQNMPVAAGSGYLWGGDLIIHWKTNQDILHRVTLYKSYSRI